MRVVEFFYGMIGFCRRLTGFDRASERDPMAIAQDKSDEAARARLLAEGTTDPRIAEGLRHVARKLEAEADALKRQSKSR